MITWKRAELIFLIAYAVVFYYFLVRKSVELATAYGSSGSLRGLKREWMWNIFNDLSDNQWRNFRGSLPALTVVMAVFALTSSALRLRWSLHGKGMSQLLLLLSIAYILYLHGACSLFLLYITLGNYIIVKVFAGVTGFPLILWLYNLAFLVVNRVYEGYTFSFFGFEYLDNYRGVLRWHIHFNFVMLRMVSFGLDYHWACISESSTIDWEKHMKNCRPCLSGSICYIKRQEKPVPLSNYAFGMYMCYLLYPPLYIAGPIISFNAFASQLETPQTTYTRADIGYYGLRWITCLILMEILSHFCYYNAMAISGIWKMLTPWEIFVVGYGVLNFMWLKFLLIWRFFRFWALVGGIEVVENMPHCINNCYDIEGFWKSWHASYNRWLVRYLYIPLGGARWRILNIWVVFTFVAIWHDLEWKLLSWAWVTCLLMAPEVCVKAVMATSLMQRIRESAIYHELCAVGGAINITGLMIANLIGFVVGPERMHWLLQSMLEPSNAVTSLGIFVSFYIGTKLMFHIRELKMRQACKTR